MALYTLDDTKLRIEFVPADGRTVHGGQVAVAALCKRLGLWKLLRAEPALDPRTDKKRGYAPEVMAARIIVTLCCGGVSLADAERLQADQGLKRALGVKRFADQTQLGEWLRGLGPAGVTALRRVLGRVAAAALALCPAGTVRTGGELEVFFDDTQLEVTGKKIEGAALNYEGKLALGWQALFVGPFLADQLVTGDNTPVSQHLPDFLAAHAALWRDTPAYFFADSASSEGKHLDLVRAQFPKWSISYNRWTEPLERAAAALPASAWTAVSPDGHYAYVRHQPEGCTRPQVYAVRRWRGDGELFERYAFCACEDGARQPRAVCHTRACGGAPLPLRPRIGPGEAAHVGQGEQRAELLVERAERPEFLRQHREKLALELHAEQRKRCHPACDLRRPLHSPLSQKYLRGPGF